MRKIALFLAMVMVFAMAVPAFANPFSDVSTNHWAYDAIVKVLASGILDGYPDGTFKGNKAVSRYEVAIIVSRVLDAVAAEREALEAELQAEMAADNAEVAAKLDEVKVELEDVVKSMAGEGLNDKQAADVALMIRALTAGFKQELKDLGVEIAEVEAALGEEIDALEARVAALEDPVFEWSAGFAIDIHDIDYVAVDDSKMYVNPFDMTNDDEEEVVFDDLDEYYEATLDLGLNIAKDGFDLDLAIDTVTDVFGSITGTYEDSTVFDVADFSGTLTTPELTATFGDAVEANITDYLFDGAEDGYLWDGTDEVSVLDGVIVDGKYGYYAFGNRDGFLNFGGKNTFTLMDQDVNVLFGVANPVQDTDLDNFKWVAGANTTFELGLFDTTVEYATDTEFDGHLFRVGVEGTVEPIDVTFNYSNVKDFTGILANAFADDKGFDLTLETEYDAVDFAYTYADYDVEDNDQNIFTAEIPAEDDDENDIRPEYYGILWDGYFEYDFLADTYEWYVNAEEEFGPVTAEAGLAYDNTDAKLEKSLGLSAELMTGLTGTADYVHVDDFTTHEYGLTFTKDIFTFDLFKNMLDDKELVLGATVDPEAINVAGVEFDSFFQYKMDTTHDTNGYQLVLGASKAVDDALTLNGGFEYGKNESATYLFTDAVEGKYVKWTVGAEYTILEDLSATFDYTNVDVDDLAGTDNYEVSEVYAGLSYDF